MFRFPARTLAVRNSTRRETSPKSKDNLIALKMHCNTGPKVNFAVVGKERGARRMVNGGVVQKREKPFCCLATFNSSSLGETTKEKHSVAVNVVPPLAGKEVERQAMLQVKKLWLIPSGATVSASYVSCLNFSLLFRPYGSMNDTQTGCTYPTLDLETCWPSLTFGVVR
jgi:hypothetical protein